MGENEENNGYGVIDLPYEELGDVSVDIQNHIKGLKDFIEHCPTPMSIALQGDWGTGKTSFLRTMIHKFEEESKNKTEENNIVTIYFNTWQYSQFNMSDDLYVSFINNIARELGKKSELQDKVEKIAKATLKLLLGFGNQYMKKAKGYDFKEMLEEAVTTDKERAEIIGDLKKDFEELVSKAAGNRGRVVIFVDDLDRLNPEIAVELLEVIKLFMDVKQCIFVLAIDYDVVISGVRKKFGNDMSEDKCRSFFEKMIQVPFSMPVERYSVEQMFEDTFKDRNQTYFAPVSKLFENILGKNPRVFKRLANSYFLMCNIWKWRENEPEKKEPEKLEELQYALMLVSLIVQTASPDVYKKLLAHEGNIEEVKNELTEETDAEINAETDAENEKKRKICVKLEEALNKLQEKCEQTKNKENMYDKFSDALNLSLSTAVDVKAEKAGMKVAEIEVLGEKKTVENTTGAFVESYNIILSKNENKMNNDFMEQQKKVLTTDDSVKKSLFRAKKQLEVTYNGNPLYLGVSSSSLVKMKQMGDLCKLMELEEGSVCWYDGDEQVFSY